MFWPHIRTLVLSNAWRLSLTGSLALAAACGGDVPPTPAPTPTPAATRVIALSGTLAFGNMPVGITATRSFVISNPGNSTLTVSQITYPSSYTGNWTGGTIAPGGSQVVLVQFAPLQAIVYTGIVTVNGDQTAGTNTIAVSGTGTPAPPEGTPFWATANCGTYKAGTYAGLACWVWVTTTGPAPGLGVTADLSAFGLSQTWGVPKCYGCGLPQEWDLDLHIPADQPAGPTPITFTVSDTAGHSLKTSANLVVTR